jgi:diguanylate cyclase (GGDEF)-like protein/PAS domain S-box-containing protein
MPASEESEIYRRVLEALQTGIFVLDRNGKVLLWSRGAEKITGFMQHEVMGRPCCDSVLALCNREGCITCGGKCPFTGTLRDGQPREVRIQLRHRQGHSSPVLMRVAPVFDGNGSIIGAAQSFDEQRFTSDSDRNQSSLAAHGCLDGTTEVPNRGYLEFQLREGLAGFEQYHLPIAVIFIQVDRLPQFRATYGHHAGGAVLRVMAQTIRNGLRPSDLLGRWADDQFLAVLPNCGQEGVLIAMDRIGKLVTYAKLQWWGDQLSITTSIGHASVQVGDSMESLVRRAQPPGAGPGSDPGSAKLEEPDLKS